jgi:predicted NBD/HSP70 family sugar kinase
MRDLAPTARHPRKTSRDDGRRWNLLTTLQTVSARAPVSRADIARATGLTRASVSSLVSELIAEDLVRETGTAERDTAGKPGTLLAINERGREIVAVDLGHQPFRAAVVDLAGVIHHEAESPSPATGTAAVDQVVALVQECLDQAQAPLLGIGVATPGMLDPDGSVRISAHLDWSDVPLRAILASRFDLPVVVGNDAHLAALAEFRSRSDAPETLLLVTVGEGIGAGLVLEGVLHTGDHLSSGEIGHVVVDPGGEPCRCGLTGCLETVAALPAVRRAAESSGLEEAAEDAARRLGATLAVVISAIDVDHLSVASELTAIPGYVEALADEVISRMHLTRRPDVSVTEAVTADPGIAGAAVAVMRSELGVVLR